MKCTFNRIPSFQESFAIAVLRSSFPYAVVKGVEEVVVVVERKKELEASRERLLNLRSTKGP